MEEAEVFFKVRASLDSGCFSTTGPLGCFVADMQSSVIGGAGNGLHCSSVAITFSVAAINTSGLRGLIGCLSCRAKFPTSPAQLGFLCSWLAIEVENGLPHRFRRPAVPLHKTSLCPGSNTAYLLEKQKSNSSHDEHVHTDKLMLKQTIERFGRQLLVPGVGISGQQRLCDGSVLIVGAGGLGSPAALYLAAAGVGRIGIIDYDRVELHNLHRQIMHTEESLGGSKAESAKRAILALNSGCHVQAINKLFDKSTAKIVDEFDVVVDASDNAMTRYLLNDTCVKYRKPLISGAALRWEGHLTTLNYGDGPCYRCLYPVPPPPEAITNCDAGGIMGPITGCIGSLQAMEALKIIIGLKPDYAQQMFMYDNGRVRTAKLRGRNPSCICMEPDNVELVDYQAFCGGARADDKTPSINVLADTDRIKANEIPTDALIIDVRPPDQFAICSLRNSVNIPLSELTHRIDEVRQLLIDGSSKSSVIAVCRRGNNSQIAVNVLGGYGIVARDVIGGIAEYARLVDPSMPIY